MVAQVKKADVYRKYNEQLDKSLPVYTMTCLDNLLNPFGNIEIECFHFRSDTAAIKFSKALAKLKEWHSWEVGMADRVVYFRNLNTNEEWPKPIKKKNKKEIRKDRKKHK